MNIIKTPKDSAESAVSQNADMEYVYSSLKEHVHPYKQKEGRMQENTR